MTRSEAINILRDAASRIELAHYTMAKFTAVDHLLWHYAVLTDPFQPWQHVSFDLYIALRMAWGSKSIDALPGYLTVSVPAGALTTDEAAVQYLRESANQLSHKS